MSQPKVTIPVQKLQLLVTKLKLLEEIAQQGVHSLETTGKAGILMDGWPTLVRGLGYVQDQLEKVVGSANMPDIHLEELKVGPSQSNKEMAKEAVEKLKADVKAARKRNQQ